MRCENESVDTKLLTRFLVKRIRHVSSGRSVYSSFHWQGISRYSICLIGNFNIGTFIFYYECEIEYEYDFPNLVCVI